jgi:hypothetical protein
LFKLGNFAFRIMDLHRKKKRLFNKGMKKTSNLN